MKKSAPTPLVNFLWVLFLSSCGVEIGNPKKPTGNPPSASFLLQDYTIASSVIASQADEVVSAIAQETKAVSLSLGLLDKQEGVPETKLTCAQNSDGTAFVQSKSSGEFNHGYNHRGRHSDNQGKRLRDSTIESWAMANKTLQCNASKDAVVIDWSTADNLTRDTVMAQDKSMDISRDSFKGSYRRKSHVQLSGQRQDKWSLDASNAAFIAHKQTITGQINKAFTSPRRSGDEVSLITQMTIKAEDPIVVTVTRDRNTQLWQNKTILSGTMITTQGEETRVEAKYANITFSFDSGCVPTGGAITGTIFNGSDQTAYRSYKVEFINGIGTITYDDGQQDPYIPDYCSFDELNSSASLSSKRNTPGP